MTKALATGACLLAAVGSLACFAWSCAAYLGAASRPFWMVGRGPTIWHYATMGPVWRC